jgi:hypothetical protein
MRVRAGGVCAGTTDTCTATRYPRTAERMTARSDPVPA